MSAYKISTRLLFTVLLFYSERMEQNLVDFTELNSKTKNKVRNKDIKIRKLSSKYIADLTNCVGSAIFQKDQEIYYTKLGNIYPLFYGFQSTLKYDAGSTSSVWNIIVNNLEKNGHLETNQLKKFLTFKDRKDFEKNVYKAYKKMTWIVSEK